MARFLLKDKHYLNVPGTQWEQTEFNQATKKQARHLYNVHLFLDPEDSSMWNYQEQIIVSTKADPAYPRDIVFVGSPTPDMEPLDEEANILLRKVLAKSVAPMSETAFPATGATPAAPAPKASSELAELRQMMAELRGQMTMLVGENEALKQRLVAKDEEDNPILPVGPAPGSSISLNLGV